MTTDRFYKENSEVLSSNGKRPHARSSYPEEKKWNENVEDTMKRIPRRRPRK